MNTIFEATTKDGARALVAPATIRKYVQIARTTRKSYIGQMNTFGRLLAQFMFCRGYVSLVEITYNHEGEQRRVCMMAQA